MLTRQHDTGSAAWWGVIGYLRWGLALSILSLDIEGLDWLTAITQTVGVVLLFLAFRTLRRENAYFRVGWYVSIFFLLLRAFNLVISATWLNTEMPGWISIALAVASFFAALLRYWSLWRGLQAAQEKAGEEHPSAKPVMALLVLHLALFPAVALLGWAGFFIWLCLLVAALVSLGTLGREMEEAGCDLQTTQEKVPDGAVLGGYLGVVLAAVLLTLLCVRGYPMDYAPVPEDTHGSMEALESELLALGFPDYVLADLADEDLAQLQNADLVEVDVEVYDRWMNTTESYAVDYDKPAWTELEQQGTFVATSVAVRVPGRDPNAVSGWVFIHHGRWLEDPGYCGAERLLLQPCWNYDGDDWLRGEVEDISGRVLYDMKGTTYASDFYDLREEEYWLGEIMGMSKTEPFALFSLFGRGTAQRWYAMYHADQTAEDRFAVRCVYTRRTGWWVYPFAAPSSYESDDVQARYYATLWHDRSRGEQ